MIKKRSREDEAPAAVSDSQDDPQGSEQAGEPEPQDDESPPLENQRISSKIRKNKNKDGAKKKKKANKKDHA